MPQPPPFNERGEVIPHDHVEIGNVDRVIRRISSNFIVPDKNSGTKRLASMAFRGSTSGSRGMSVDIPQFIADAGHDPEFFITHPRWIGAIWFNVGQLRQLGFKVGFAPIPLNPFHGEVWGEFNRQQVKNLQILAQWFIEIPDVSIT